MLSVPNGLKLGFVTLLVLIMAVGISAAQPTTTPDDELGKMTAKLDDAIAKFTEPQRRQLKRVLVQLHQADPQAKDWETLIPQLKIEVPQIDWSVDMEEPDGKAPKWQPNQPAKVRLNMLLLARLTDHSYGAARYFIAEMTGSDLKEAHGPVHDWLAVNINSHALAWVFAHEITHLRLGHPKKSIKSLDDSRNRELAADLGSFELLNRAGYSMMLLYGFFNFEMMREEALVHTGKKLDKTLMTHPTWATRRSQLLNYIKSTRAPRQRWIMFSTLTTTSSGLMKRTYILPGDGTSLGLTFLNIESLTPAGVEYLADGKGVMIYERYSDARIVSYLEVVDAHATYLHVNYSLNKEQGKDHVMTAFRDSFSGIAADDEKGIISSALQTTSLGPLYQALDKVTTDKQKREAGRRIYQDRAMSLSHANLRFFKGELSQQELVAKQQTIIAQYASELEKALGRSTVEAVDTEVARWAVDMIRRQTTNPQPLH